MALPREHDGYRSFQYLKPGGDHREVALAPEIDRVEPAPVPLTEEEERRVERLAASCLMISFHEHAGRFPADIEETPAYLRVGRQATAFEGLAASYWDVVFDNLMDGICRIHSHSGWQWGDVVHDLGMRLCDLAHQETVAVCRSVDDIRRARREGKVGWIASMEGAAMIENELDRIDLLFGLGVRCLGVTYSEANALGSGLREPGDAGLTRFGRRAVKRMNRVGMLIDCSHAGDRTTLDTVEVSEHPVVLTHVGARALWDSRRLAPDEVLVAVAESGGVIGIEAAPHTTVTERRPVHDLASFMEHFEYVVDRVGIDHVTFGPDTLYGDHVGLHHAYAAELSIEDSRRGRGDGAREDSSREAGGSAAAGDGEAEGGSESGGFREVEYVRGIENPTEGSRNILRWLVKRGYDDGEIERVLGGNVLRVLEAVWP